MKAQDTATQWLAEEEAILSRQTLGMGIARREDVAGMSGIEMLQAMIAGKTPRAPMSATLDFIQIRVEQGIAHFQAGHTSRTTTRSAPFTVFGSRRSSIRRWAAPSNRRFRGQELHHDGVQGEAGARAYRGDSCRALRGEDRAFGSIFGDGRGAAVWA
jgi:hypothetical protein